MRSASPLMRLVLCCIAAGLVLAGMALPIVGGAGFLARAASHSFDALPDVLRVPPPPQRSVLVTADGHVFASFFQQYRVPVPLQKVAPAMQQALIAIEDARFYDHGAIDVRGTVRAALTDLERGQPAQGGSTLTQQYVKNALLYSGGDRAATADSVGRKVREARLAIGVEKRLTKRQVLERYLNLVYFGNGAYGVQAAAQRYFSETAGQLSLRQAALLAGLVQAPETYDPIRHRHAAKARRNTVLRRMAQLHDIPAARAQRLMHRPLGLEPTRFRSGCDLSLAPFFCAYVHQELLSDARLGRTRAARERTLMTGGLTVHTTLDPKVQAAAAQAVHSTVPATSRVASAVASVDPGTGRVVGMAASRRYGADAKHGQTRVDLATGGDSGFQAGSTFKMFTLAAAIDKGVPLDLTLNAPHQVHLSGFRGCHGTTLGSWAPKNAEAGEGGRYGLVRATWESVNTYFAQLERKIGVCRPWRLAKQMGITEISTGKAPAQVPAFTLGSDDTSPLQVAGAYATLAARGRFCRPYGVVSITRPDGKPLERRHARCRRVLPQHVADVTTSILRGIIDGPDPARTGASASIGRPAAGKTGTTDSFAAAWFSGFTPDLATSVWVGDPRGGAQHPLRNVSVGGRFYPYVYGADIPATIWRLTMRGALHGEPVRHFRGAAATIMRDRSVPPAAPAPAPAPPGAAPPKQPPGKPPKNKGPH